jgi:hypothetical protein
MNTELAKPKHPIRFYFALFFLLGSIALTLGFGWSHLGMALCLSGGATAAGGLFGFLFGIPRVLQKNGKSPSEDPGSMAASNTNLEQVSDWLTAIIIGASLVQLESIGNGLDWLSTKVAFEISAGPLRAGDTGKGYVLGYFSILYFFIGGFMFSYLFTRLNLIEAFSNVEWRIRQAQSTAINATTEKDLLLEQFARTLESQPSGESPGLMGEGDQNKGQFGGTSEVNERKLTAKVTPLGPNSIHCRVDMMVTGSVLKPLVGRVTFHLHETYKPKDQAEVIAVNNQATFTIFAYGAFTIGAVADDGQTRLELDLADPALGGPEAWRRR